MGYPITYSSLYKCPMLGTVNVKIFRVGVILQFRIIAKISLCVHYTII